MSLLGRRIGVYLTIFRPLVPNHSRQRRDRSAADRAIAALPTGRSQVYPAVAPDFANRLHERRQALVRLLVNLGATRITLPSGFQPPPRRPRRAG